MPEIWKLLTSNASPVQVVCSKQYVFACGVAVARAFPTYTLKTRDVPERSVTVCFLTPDQLAPLTEQDVKVLTSTATGQLGGVCWEF